MRLEARDLTVRYAGAPVPALDGVSLALAPGELVAVAGPNGSGKSTLVRALLGLVVPQRGEALIDGRPSRTWARDALARQVAVVPQQEERVFPLRVHEAVLLGRYAHLTPLAPAGARDRAIVEAALRRTDAWDLRDRTTDTLSGGEWQRVRIARALAQEPSVLILDEPTASLDVRHAMELFELVRSLAHGGLAALVVTHELNLAARFADRMVLLGCGHLVADGPPAAVLTRETLSRLFAWPVAVTTWCDGSPQVVPLRPSEALEAPTPSPLPESS